MFHHSTKFGGHRHCGSRDIMIFVCYVTSQNHVIHHDTLPIKVRYHPVKIGGHSNSGSRDIMIFVCHVTLQNQDL